MSDSLTINTNIQPKQVIGRTVSDNDKLDRTVQVSQPEITKKTFGEDLSHIKDHLKKSGEMIWRAVKMNKNFLETEVAMVKHVVMPTIHYDQVVRGTLVATDQVFSGDGDMDFEIVPDPEYKHLLNYKGKDKSYKIEYGEKSKMIIPEKGKALWEKEGAINAEIKMDTYKELQNEAETLRYLLKKGETPHVEFRGVHTYDPFHQGYIELHPVRSIKILPDPAGHQETLSLRNTATPAGYDADPMVKILSAPPPEGASNAEGEILIKTKSKK